jgi:6-phosphogluconate dehydrogenase
MAIAGKEHGWELDFARIAKIWRAGCIIRAVFLQSITQAYENNESLANLLLDPFFSDQITRYQNDWRTALSKSIMAGIPSPAMTSAIAYYDAYRTETLPANLLQGQRDFFGAHTFERTDKKPGCKYHVQWSEPTRPMVQVKK